MSTSIVLADEHTIFRDAVRSLIENDHDLAVVGEAENGDEALALVESLKPDLVLTEVALPGLSGIEVTRRVVRGGCSSRFLILSSNVGGRSLERALAAGAAGYVCKTDSSDDLLRAIDSVRCGRRFVSPSVAHHLVEIVATGARDQEAGSKLTGREREVLQRVAEGLSSKEIAAALGVSPRTVESHRASLMEKLGIHKVSGLVRYAIREEFVRP